MYLEFLSLISVHSFDDGITIFLACPAQVTARFRNDYLW